MTTSRLATSLMILAALSFVRCAGDDADAPPSPAHTLTATATVSSDATATATAVADGDATRIRPVIDEKFELGLPSGNSPSAVGERVIRQ